MSKKRYISWVSVNETNKDFNKTYDTDNSDENDEYQEFDDDPEMSQITIPNSLVQSLDMIRQQSGIEFTPIGLMNRNDPWSPINVYEIYVGHIHGARLDNRFYLELLKIEGIDLIRKISPYSFAVAPAVTYDWRDVRVAIENIVGQHDDQEDEFSVFCSEFIRKKLRNLKKDLDDKNEPYFIYVLPNGIFLSKIESDQDFNILLTEVEKNKKENEKAILIKNGC